MTTRVSTVADGVTTLFSIPFPYLDRDHVKVMLNGVLQSPSEYTWPTSSSIQFIAPPDPGARVTRYRETPSDPLTIYQSGSVLTRDQLEVDSLQALYRSEEAEEVALRLPVNHLANTLLPSPEPLTLIGWDASATQAVNYDLETFGLQLAAGAQYQAGVLAGQTALTLEVPEPFGIQAVFYNGVFQAPESYTHDGTSFQFNEPFPADGLVSVLATVVALGATPDASELTYTASGGTSRSLQSRLSDSISAADYAAPADAVARAVAVSGAVYWPAGDHAASGSVAGLWDVQHSGPGRLVRGAVILPMTRVESSTVTLYVDPAGDDANDGLTSDAPLATISRALAIFTDHGSRGRWTIQLAAGTYTENIAASSLTPMEFPLDIRGPTVGHPNVPTAVIAAANTAADVATFSEGGWYRLYDVLLSGATSASGLNVQRCRVTATNVHISGCLNAAVNQHGALLGAVGGIWTGLGAGVANGWGYRSFYNATHSLVASSAAGALVIEDYEVGMLLNEGVQGHLDYTIVQDCGTGIRWNRGAGACNTLGMTLRRNGVGIEANNQWFNNGIVFGTGADANTVNVRTAGSAPEFDYRANDYKSKTKRLQESVYGVSHTGTTAATVVYEFDDIRPWMVSEGGDATEIIAVLNNAASAGTISVNFFMWDGTTEDFLAGVALPAGTTHATVRGLIHFASANGQRCAVSAVHNAGASMGAYGTGVLNLKDKSCSIRMKVVLSNAADTATFPFIETHSTLGG